MVGFGASLSVLDAEKQIRLRARRYAALRGTMTIPTGYQPHENPFARDTFRTAQKRQCIGCGAWKPAREILAHEMCQPCEERRKLQERLTKLVK